MDNFNSNIFISKLEIQIIRTENKNYIKKMSFSFSKNYYGK